MKTCPKCNKEFSIILKKNKNGKKSCLIGRKFCYECSPLYSHNTQNLEYYDKIIPGKQERICYSCHKSLPETAFYRKTNSGYCRKCFYIIQNEYRKNIKNKCIEYMGGECKFCGYSKCIGALEFHHLNPSIKDELVCRSRSFEKIKKELDKCILLCSNCHREKHESLGLVTKAIRMSK